MNEVINEWMKEWKKEWRNEGNESCLSMCMLCIPSGNVTHLQNKTQQWIRLKSIFLIRLFSFRVSHGVGSGNLWRMWIFLKSLMISRCWRTTRNYKLPTLIRVTEWKKKEKGPLDLLHCFISSTRCQWCFWRWWWSDALDRAESELCRCGVTLRCTVRLDVNAANGCLLTWIQRANSEVWWCVEGILRSNAPLMRK